MTATEASLPLTQKIACFIAAVSLVVFLKIMLRLLGKDTTIGMFEYGVNVLEGRND